MPLSTAIQVSVKVSPSVIKTAEELRPYLGTVMGHDASRADVLRRAMSLGLKQLKVHLRRRARAEAPADDGDDLTVENAEVPHG